MKFQELVPKPFSFRGIATSIDALSVGFTISEYDWLMALVCSPDHCHSHILYLHDRTFPWKTLRNQAFQQGGYSRRRHSYCNWSGNFYEQYVLIFSAYLSLFNRYCSARCFTIQALIFTCFPIKKAFISPFTGWMKAFSAFISGQ